MIKSMTGFGAAKGFISPCGSTNLEIRSNNHRFLDIVLHLPEGFLHLEQSIKSEIAKKMKRGHIVCRLEVNPFQLKKPLLNTHLIRDYYLSLKQISRQLNLKQQVDINTLAALPGVWTMQSRSVVALSWTKLRPLVKKAVDKIVQVRSREGRALCKDLRSRVSQAEKLLGVVKTKFKKVVEAKVKNCKTEDEKNGFLKSADITEEVVRLAFHLKNFRGCLQSSNDVGKELDFVLQEMQRESNTIGAKSIDGFISGCAVRLKSEIEKMREQVQNVE